MRINLLKLTCIFLLFIIVTLTSTAAQDESSVNIAFDTKSKRTNIITGEELPDYKLAKRGSIQFFFKRLDEPDDFVCFTHDGINKAYIKDLQKMEKVQGKFAVWRLSYRSGSKNTPRIQHLAVSFIPLTTDTKKTERRVYVLMNDLEMVEWVK